MTAQDDDAYSAESLKRLRDENAVQFKLVPLTQSEQKTLEEDDALMQYMDATEMVDAPKPVETIVIGDDEEEDDDQMFRSKQVEAARALRAKLKRGEQTIAGETSRDAMDAPQGKGTSSMDVDSNKEDNEDEEGPISDDEDEERRAVGVTDYNGRHYFADAVVKTKHGDTEALRSQTQNVEQDTDNFFNRPEESDLEWELELIRRSGVKRSHQSIGNAHNSATLKSTAMARMEIQTIPDRAVEPFAEDDIVKKIEKDLLQMKSVASLHENRLASIEASREENSAILSKSDAAYSQANNDLQYFEDFKLYMMDLMDCIESKLPLIEDVEEKMFQTRLARVRKTQARIKSAFVEELEATRSKSATSSDVAGSWRTWRALKKLSRAQAHPHADFSEGYSSDEETTEEYERLYETSLGDVREAAVAVFEDALPEFCDLGAILQRIASFRSLYTVSYTQAHISSQIPALLGPLVRLELVSWNPLNPNSNVLQWPWFECFNSFVHNSANNTSADGDSGTKMDTENSSTMLEADATIIASIASDVIIPKVKEAIKFFWRANSLTDTKTIQNLLFQLRSIIPAKPLSEVLVAVNLGLKHAIASFELPKGPTPNSDYASVAFSRAIKLLSVSVAWKTFFSPEATRSMVCELIVNERIVPHLMSIRTDLAATWDFLKILINALGPYLSETSPEYLPTLISALEPLDDLISRLASDSLAHYQLFDFVDSIKEAWNCLKTGRPAQPIKDRSLD